MDVFVWSRILLWNENYSLFLWYEWVTNGHSRERKSRSDGSKCNHCNDTPGESSHTATSALMFILYSTSSECVQFISNTYKWEIDGYRTDEREYEECSISLSAQWPFTIEKVSKIWSMRMISQSLEDETVIRIDRDRSKKPIEIWVPM